MLIELIPVKEQFDPNPDFPTVEYPNPEEGASSLQLAIRAAESHSATFIFANDPDADRFLVAERMSGSSSDGWKIFNGNEIAAILAHFISESRVCTQLSCTQDCTQHHKQQICMLSSCVSSRFLKRLCAHHAFHHETTATGFKNLGNRAWELQQFCSRRPVFAYEEAIGFAVGEWNFDKDGVSALATMLACIRRHGSLLELLQRIYRLYGATPLQCNGYLLVGQPRTAIDRMLAERIPALRRRFPEVTVVAAAEKATELLLPQPDSWLMIRASGTEPKVKYYSEMMLPSGDASDCQESFEKLVQDVVKYLLE